MTEIIKLEDVDTLPCVIKQLIFEMLPNNKKIFLNKKYYKKYHYLIRKIIINKSVSSQFFSSYGMESYIRSIVRNDYYFPFERLIDENFNKWLFMKRYRYKDMVFQNYIRFLIYYCNEFEASSCLNKLITNDKYIKLFGICKKEHKNIINTSIRWTN